VYLGRARLHLSFALVFWCPFMIDASSANGEQAEKVEKVGL
jgi:hypothetical protein